MSSYITTISISDQEWARIQKCVRDTDTYVARQHERAERLRKEIQRRQQLLQEAREQTRKTVDSAVAVLQGGFARAVRELAGVSKEAAEKQAAGFAGELEGLRADIRATGARTAAASGQISKLSREFNRVLTELAGQNESSGERARLFLDELHTICTQIDQLNPQAFAPEKYRELMQISRDADANNRSGSSQAALIAAQNGVSKASVLLAELIVSNEEYDGLLADVAGKADSVKERFDILSPEMEGAITFDLDGEQMEFEYDIEHWSGGHYGKLKKEFQQLYDRVQQAKEDKMPVKQLGALGTELERLGRQLEQCDAGARQELLGSLNAQETAARLCDSLQGNDWSLEEHGFENGDDRSPYTMIYKDGMGNSIAMVVAPGASADQPNIFLEAFTRKESHTDVIKRNVHGILADEGIRIEGTQHLEDCRENPDKEAFIRHTLPKAQALNAARRKKSFGTA